MMLFKITYKRKNYNKIKSKINLLINKTLVNKNIPLYYNRKIIIRKKYPIYNYMRINFLL